MGRAKLYDFVLHNDKKSKKVRLRIKGAAMSLFNLRGEWKSMEGYTCFWKGVKLTHRTDPPPPPAMVDVDDKARIPRSETEDVFDGLEAGAVSVDSTEWSHDVDVNMGMNAIPPRDAN